MLKGAQIKLSDVNEEYKAFVDKFKPKKTTDDCYTPPNIYEAARDWACKESGSYVIIDEYDEVISFEDFIEMVEDKQSVENPDNFTYDKNVNGYRFTDGEFS